MRELLKKTLQSMKDTVNSVLMYGMENTGICDLRVTASENLDVDAEDKNNEEVIEGEVGRIEGKCREVCGSIISLLQNVSVDSLTDCQCARLKEELSVLSVGGDSVFGSASDYIKNLIAEYALYEDSCSLDDLKSALELMLESVRKIKAVVIPTSLSDKIKVVELDDTYRSYYPIIKCRLIDVVELYSDDRISVDCVVDDEGILNDKPMNEYWLMSYLNGKSNSPLYGITVITMTDLDTGETIDTDLSFVKNILIRDYGFSASQLRDIN